jgi:dolichyl-phosphate-mannose-protein mannosyltransferase
MKLSIDSKTVTIALHGLLVFLIAYCTYFRNYWYPPALFWDENYHIASAYKYLNHVMFMEPHPPLGKLLIALGEYLFHPNTHINTTSFLTTDYINSIPYGFSFVGVRFFPVLLATLSSVLFFFILYAICKNSFTSFLFSSFYLFDNALILQSRAAMLDSILLFFVLGTLLYFLLLLEAQKSKSFSYFVLGLLAGLAIAVKLNAAVLLLLFFPLFCYQHRPLSLKILISKLPVQAILFLTGSALVFCGIYYIHGMLGQTILDDRSYNASGIYRQVLNDKTSSDPIYFPIILRDNLLYSKQYEAGVPKYKPNDPTENGSLPYTWPFGDKAINYRWEVDNGTTRYLYLVGNPLIWLSGLIGLVSAVGLLIVTLVFRRPIHNRKLFFTIIVLLSLYITYMIAIMQIQRVLYLYLYIIPLVLSLLLAFTVYSYVFEKAIQLRDRRLIAGTVIFVLLIILIYAFFSPLTYYMPLTKDQFLMRSWFSFWHMKPVG